jgi:hypothetical protein
MDVIRAERSDSDTFFTGTQALVVSVYKLGKGLL